MNKRYAPNPSNTWLPPPVYFNEHRPGQIPYGHGFHPLTFVSKRFYKNGQIMYTPKGVLANCFPKPYQYDYGKQSDFSKYNFFLPERLPPGYEDHNYTGNLNAQNIFQPEACISTFMVHHVENGVYSIRITGNIPPQNIYWDPYHISPLKQFHKNQMRNFPEPQSSGYSSAPSSTGFSNHQQQFPPIQQQSRPGHIRENVPSSSHIVEEPDEQEPVRNSSETAKSAETETVQMKVEMLTELVEGIRGLNKQYEKLERRMENIEAGMISVGSVVREHLKRPEQDIRQFKDTGTATDGSHVTVPQSNSSPISATVSAKVEPKQPKKVQTVPKQCSDVDAKLPVSGRQPEVQKNTSSVPSSSNAPVVNVKKPETTVFSNRSMFAATEFPVLERSTSPPPLRIIGRLSGVSRRTAVASSSPTPDRPARPLTLKDFLLPVRSTKPASSSTSSARSSSVASQNVRKPQGDQKSKTSQSNQPKPVKPDIPKPVQVSSNSSSAPTSSGAPPLHTSKTAVQTGTSISLTTTKSQAERNRENSREQDFAKFQAASTSAKVQLVPVAVEKKIGNGSDVPSTSSSFTSQVKPNVLVLEVPKASQASRAVSRSKSENSKKDVKVTTATTTGDPKKKTTPDAVEPVTPVNDETPQPARIETAVVETPGSSKTTPASADRSLPVMETSTVLEVVKFPTGMTTSCSNDQGASGSSEVKFGSENALGDVPGVSEAPVESPEVPEVVQEPSDSKEPHLTRKQRKQLENEQKRLEEKEKKKAKQEEERKIKEQEEKEEKKKKEEEEEKERLERLQTETPPPPYPEPGYQIPAHLLPVFNSLNPEQQYSCTDFISYHNSLQLRSIQRYIIESNLRKQDERFRIKFEERVTEKTRLIYDICRWSPEKQVEYEKCEDPMKFFKDRNKYFEDRPQCYVLVLFFRNILISSHEVFKFDSFCIGEALKDFKENNMLVNIDIQYMALVSGNPEVDVSHLLYEMNNDSSDV